MSEAIPIATESRVTNYRRTLVPSATHFFTVNLARSDGRLLIDRIDDLRGAVRYAMGRHPCRIDAMVVVFDHLHAVWALLPGDADHRRLLKSGLPVASPKESDAAIAGSPKTSAASGNGAFDTDDEGMQRHVDYVHFNPVKHGLVERAGDRPHFTFHVM